MPWITTVSLEAAKGLLARIYSAAQARAGRVYQILQIQSVEPEVLERSLGLYLATMQAPSELSRAEREMVAVVVSRSNRCHY